jgi:hypothetical protein
MHSQNIPGNQQHRQSGLSEVAKQLYIEPRETEYLPWSFTANQQTPADTRSSSSLSPANRTPEPPSGARILDEPGQNISERQCKSGLNPRRIESPPTKKDEY